MCDELKGVGDAPEKVAMQQPKSRQGEDFDPVRKESKAHPKLPLHVVAALVVAAIEIYLYPSHMLHLWHMAKEAIIASLAARIDPIRVMLAFVSVSISGTARTVVLVAVIRHSLPAVRLLAQLSRQAAAFARVLIIATNPRSWLALAACIVLGFLGAMTSFLGWTTTSLQA